MYHPPALVLGVLGFQFLLYGVELLADRLVFLQPVAVALGSSRFQEEITLGTRIISSAHQKIGIGNRESATDCHHLGCGE